MSGRLAIFAERIAVEIDLAVGHVARLTIERDGRTLEPLHRASWADDPDALADALADGLKRLSGDFLCAPFSASDIEAAPLHGWPGNSPWDVVETGPFRGGWQARLRLARTVLGATVEKIVTVRDGHPFLYTEHRFIGGGGELPVALHPMTEMRDGGRLAFSPKRLAATPPEAPEPDPARGRSRLSYPASSDRLEAFPLAGGGTTDLRDYAAVTHSEDFITLVEADHGGIGWTALARRAERDLVLVLKNPAVLPVTMLWLSNGGRDYEPWNGRAGVLGIEDGRTAIGHAASIGDNWLKREGLPTSFTLGGVVAVRHVLGGLPWGGEPPSSLVAEGDSLAVHSGGAEQRIPFDAGFLAGDAASAGD